MTNKSEHAKNRVRLAINGFGRTGRAACRIALLNPNCEIVAINSKADAKNYAYLLKYDSLYGMFPGEVKVIDETTISYNGQPIKVFSQKSEEMPWKNLDIDIVLESSGRFSQREKANLHREFGAKRVIITAPAEGEDASFVLGVNEKIFDPKKHFIVSNASCTTNCLALLAMLLDEKFKIVTGYMNTVHAYTNDQRLHDNSHPKDLRRARAAANSIIPTSTGAAKAIGVILPKLEGKLDGIALRVPVPTVSLLSFTVLTKKTTTVKEINKVFKDAEKGILKGILGTSDEPLVSVDFKGDSRSSIVDTALTSVLNGNLITVFSWYDNEWGYAARLIDLAVYIHKHS
ncbi:type I glyceraldehyde-3-phosphate dehydrogenase [Candidatus Gottesmanbacteria bacterium]|nr:type I glyceraldehyde-3-phosphate dehydrogenase [Candidatus Gottesmanbacteria bacterium]